MEADPAQFDMRRRLGIAPRALICGVYKLKNRLLLLLHAERTVDLNEGRT